MDEPVDPPSAAPDAPPSAAPGAADAGARPRGSVRPIPDDALIILPVRGVVLFPATMFPLAVAGAKAQAAVQEAVRLERPIGVLLQREPEAEDPAPGDLHWVGASAAVLRYVTTPDGMHHAVARGLRRFRVLQVLEGYPFTVAQVQYFDDPEQVDSEVEGRARALKQRALETLELLPQVPAEMVAALQAIESPGQLADVIAGLLDIGVDEKQSLLETFDLKARLDRLLQILAHRIEVLKVSREVAERTRESIGDVNRKHLLREQMRTIQKELGEGDEAAAEIDELGQAIAGAHMPEEVDKAARKELKRLERMPEAAAEYSMLRTYLDWLIELPWAEPAEQPIDIAQARRILDEDHFGLDKIKRRILEHLAVRKLNPSGHAPILCFVGPPGVGKTSLGQSIAKATGRSFARLSLGGVHDEAEIRGHRRTYVGAMPGTIVRALRDAGSRNPVFMIDEIDKMGADFRGDPASAMLEVLDPAQNDAFRDHYLDLDFDLSEVIFIATANVLDPIPPPLRDRMEVIQLSGYTVDEKLHIARRYLVPRQVRENGLKSAQARFSDAALRAIIEEYTREAGVRDLERQIGTVCRKLARAIAERGKRAKASGGSVSAKRVRELLGRRLYFSEARRRTRRAGVATGLAWTPVGGEVLFIEATSMPGSGRLTITGQLGDVMRESAQAALSLIRSEASDLIPDLDPTWFATNDIHVHVPAGAVPKDGPSAGVAMTVALASLLTGRPVRNDVAMTGEITLTGQVLPVGGLKEKSLAAQRAGIKRVIAPDRNEGEILEIPEHEREGLEFVYVSEIEQALDAALEARRVRAR